MASQINASNSGFGGIVSTGDSSGVLQLQAAGTTIATIQSTGMAVTGTLSSSGVSTFVAGTAALPAITTTGDTNTGMFFPAADTIAFAEGGTEAMRLDSSGNVGIGTTSPTDSLGYGKALDIQSSTGSAIYLRDSDATSEYTWVSYEGGATKATTIGNTAAGPMIFATNGTNRMRIDSSGNVLIGTTTLGGALTVFASSGVGARIRIQELGPTIMQFRNAQDLGGSISIQSGGGTTYATSSDYRLKENIVPMTGALDKVALLKPVTYKWKVDGSDGQGFIAHELQAVLPDAVVGEKDAVDEEGNPSYQGVDTSFLVATLTAAIQEMKAIIDEQSARITALEAK